jgi:hemerythrin-like metal-binding protein
MILWTENLSCNNPEIDEQHKKWIEIMNKISSILVNRKYEYYKVVEIYKELDTYVEKHFAFEEELMKKNGYPEIKDHIIEHNKLRHKMKDFDLFNTSKREEFFSDVLIYLTDWLMEHIMETDKNLGFYLTQK